MVPQWMQEFFLKLLNCSVFLFSIFPIAETHFAFATIENVNNMNVLENKQNDWFYDSVEHVYWLLRMYSIINYISNEIVSTTLVLMRYWPINKRYSMEKHYKLFAQKISKFNKY